MDNPIELKDVNKLKEINGNKPRASSTSEIESQLNQASTSTSESKKPRTRIQFKLPGETTPLMIERDKSNEVSDLEASKDASTSEGAVVEKPEMAIVPSSHIERQTSEEDEEILEVLRRVVRSCTDADLSKRPSANEILDMLTKYIDQDDPLE